MSFYPSSDSFPEKKTENKTTTSGCKTGNGQFGVKFRPTQKVFKFKVKLKFQTSYFTKIYFRGHLSSKEAAKFEVSFFIQKIYKILKLTGSRD